MISKDLLLKEWMETNGEAVTESKHVVFSKKQRKTYQFCDQEEEHQ